VLDGSGSFDPNSQFLGEEFGGNILRYGIGYGYDLGRCSNGCRRLTFVHEFVGWTVLDGLKTSPGTSPGLVEDALGDTIVNMKYGLRFTRDCHSVYAGHGFNLTSERWYENILRFEYRRTF
jgi:hypothetical protein